MITVEICELNETNHKCSKCGELATHRIITCDDKVKVDDYSICLCDIHTNELRGRLKALTRR